MIASTFSFYNRFVLACGTLTSAAPPVGQSDRGCSARRRSYLDAGLSAAAADTPPASASSPATASPSLRQIWRHPEMIRSKLMRSMNLKLSVKLKWSFHIILYHCESQHLHTDVCEQQTTCT